MEYIKNIFKLLRLKHWIKNLVVFLPIIFSLNIFNSNYFEKVFIGFLSFCFISSAIYVMNDIKDVTKDRNHPIKKFRPIASNLISVKAAYFIFCILGLLSFILSYFISLKAIFIICLYLFNNILYTFWGKKYEITDVLMITIGFILRILMGCVACCVIPSVYTILLTVFLSFFFGFSKRYIELKMGLSKTRESISLYNIDMLNQLISISACVSIVLYILFSAGIEIQTNIVSLQNAKFFYVTAIPFTIAIFRLISLINNNKEIDDPCNYFYKDKFLQICFFCYFIMIIFFIL